MEVGYIMYANEKEYRGGVYSIWGIGCIDMLTLEKETHCDNGFLIWLIIFYYITLYRGNARSRVDLYTRRY